MGDFGPVQTLEATGRGRMRSISCASEFANVGLVTTAKYNVTPDKAVKNLVVG